MKTTITDHSAARAERVFLMHLSMFTNPDMALEDYANLYTDDAVHEYPYAPAPFSTKLEGRDAIAAYISNVTKSATEWSFTDFKFTATSDSDIVFVEFEGNALVNATGKTYRQIYIGRITLRENQISHYREFWNPSWILDAFVPAPSV
ncbi:nuclear transport factor 2 family protein [Dyadobacter sp. 3J3]|uniref:nuclear transport factor 2 family protein n=1 Tax=Dyadobacter sp. 3J3 TaxID=2606600 RepID=UPI001E3C1FAD|nr:nuclear transport factor 2 family protein [Dyadobacter sp. 3J3]